MKNIYLLQVMCNLDEEMHYENVYSTKEKALEDGKKVLDQLLRKQYDDWFEDDKGLPELTHEQLFKLKALYDFTVTEFNPKYVDNLKDEELQVVTEWDMKESFLENMQPVKIKYSFDYNGKPDYITGVFIFKYKGKRKEYEVQMKYEDYLNKDAGTKFKKGDIVKLKDGKKKQFNYDFNGKLHVITDTPYKCKNQKFFNNTYNVIVNHNRYDEGCHVDIFRESDLELYTEELPKDSPIIFLSKYFKGEVELKNIRWMDIECGKITLNENKSFRDIPEIMEQLSNLKARNETKSEIIEEINNIFFKGLMSKEWKGFMDDLLKKYEFDDKTIIELLRYCFNRSALHRNYVQAVAESWNTNNIKTFNDLDIYYQKREKLNVLYKSVGKKLGYNRPLTEYEEKLIEKWNIDYGYDFNVIEYAISKITTKKNSSFNYLDKIISDWNERNLKDIKEIEIFLESLE